MSHYALCRIVYPNDTSENDYSSEDTSSNGKEAKNIISQDLYGPDGAPPEGDGIYDYCKKIKDIYKYSLYLPADKPNESSILKQSIPEDQCDHDGECAHPITHSEKFAEREKDLVRQAVEDLAVPIPILGLRVDANDIWFFCGPITLLSLLVLVFTLRSDRRNIELARNYSEASEDVLTLQNLELLEATCVLGRRDDNPLPSDTSLRPSDIARYRIILWCVVLVPMVNSAVLLGWDFIDHEGTLFTSPALEFSTTPVRVWSGAELFLELVSLLAVLRTALVVKSTFDSLSKTVQSVRAKAEEISKKIKKDSK